MGLMNIAVYCPNCEVLMNIHKGTLGDDTIEFKCPKCGDIEKRTSTPTKDMITEASTCGESLCLNCVNNKMCRAYQHYLMIGLFVTGCTHYTKRAIGND